MSDRSQLTTRIREGATVARRPLTKPRKTASQARSRATVDALVEATARILVRDGFDLASTNRIAAEAGVSIGSLYQYFPSKEALVAAVVERHNRDLMQVVQAALAKVAREPIELGMRRLVAAAVEAHRIDPALHRVLAEQTPRAGALADVELLHREGYGLFRAYLEDHREELAGLNLDLAAFVCVTSIEALTHTAVIHSPAMLADEHAVATLVDEAARLVTGYLRPGLPAAA
jgi:AcrR family transcriptional regulator